MGYEVKEGGTPNITCANAYYPVVGNSGSFTDTEWVGVGGDSGTQYLAQDGVTMKPYYYNNQYVYVAWYERWPTDTYIVPVFTVSLGDQMVSDVVLDSGTGLWNFFIEDMTSGSYYSHEYPFQPNRATAEWTIETADSVNFDPGTFSAVNFTGCWWMTPNYAQLPINSNQATWLYINPNKKATISLLDSTGTQFSITAPGNNQGNGYH